jgi:hypothetical protein
LLVVVGIEFFLFVVVTIQQVHVIEKYAKKLKAGVDQSLVKVREEEMIVRHTPTNGIVRTTGIDETVKQKFGVCVVCARVIVQPLVLPLPRQQRNYSLTL